jgi:glycosyltransferase involved in cell wall biosynthesis
MTINMEGLPNTVIEMLASGVPVVATNCGGILEVQDDGQTGVCVGINDDYGMAQQTLKQLRDVTLRETMDSMGKQVARERFSLNKMTETTESIYEELLKLKPR